MRRLKHNPELVAWGEAYLVNEDTETKWKSESIYPLMSDNDFAVLMGCEAPLGQYLLKVFRPEVDDSVYISAAEFILTPEIITENNYNCDGIYESFNGDIVPLQIGYYIHPDTGVAVLDLGIGISATSPVQGTTYFKLWRIAQYEKNEYKPYFI